MAAAVEQHHDADGIVWPLALAPFEIELVSLNPSDDGDARRRPMPLYAKLLAAGLEVFYDDRDERPGVKFKDADLLGFPIRVNVGGPGAQGRQGRDRVCAATRACARSRPAEAVEAVQGAPRASSRAVTETR